MLIPLTAKNPEVSDFECRDGEIEFLIHTGPASDDNLSQSEDSGIYTDSGDLKEATDPSSALRCSLTTAATYPTANIRIPLEAGDAEKVALIMNGEATRVDPAACTRLTRACIREAAAVLLQLTTDWRRKGCFLLPLRVFTMIQTADGKFSHPSAQGVALPTDFPPHPEIMAYTAAEDCLTLSLRFPVKPHRLDVILPQEFPTGLQARVFISYPLYIPDPKEMEGSFGSVRSATGGNAPGLRFSFLSVSSVKASVAAPEKYYEIAGNERTGYRISSRLAPAPDYCEYAGADGRLQPFPKDQMLICGSEVDEATDPMDWIADWREEGNAYLPRFLPNMFAAGESSSTLPVTAPETAVFPAGLSREVITGMAEERNLRYILLTRPMAFADSTTSRRKGASRGILRMRIHGLPDSECLALWICSDNGVHWETLRILDPHREHLMLAPRRPWHRLMLLSATKPEAPCIEAETGQL